MRRFDASISIRENSRFNRLYRDAIKQLVEETEFSSLEVKSILMVFHKFVLENGPKARTITNEQFSNIFKIIFGVYDSLLIDRMYAKLSGKNRGVGPKAWVRLFSVFLSEKLEPKLKFIFEVYNTSELGVLNRHVIMRAVSRFFEGEDEDEMNGLKLDMLEYILMKFDVDRDGVISFEDYATVVKRDPMMLEFLGRCFPTVSKLQTTTYCMNIKSKIET